MNWTRIVVDVALKYFVFREKVQRAEVSCHEVLEEAELCSGLAGAIRVLVGSTVFLWLLAQSLPRSVSR
jgi:hypothetical protein